MIDSAKLSISQLHSLYCVYRDLDIGTKTVNCCTCGKLIHIDEPQDCFQYYGHYIPRSVSRLLKYHPYNAHPQCLQCNLNETIDIRKNYDRYMIYRYGKNIKDKLLSINQTYTEDQYKEYYINELLKLTCNFPKLAKLLIDDDDTGEIINFTQIHENDIEEQFYTFSQTYKQDLDKLCKMLKVKNFIEWERI